MDDNSPTGSVVSLNAGGGLYLPPSWHGLKQQIIYLAQFGGSLQVVHGAKGAGKTTLFRLLLEENFCEDFISVALGQDVQVEKFLYELLWRLGLRPEEGGSLGSYVVVLRSYAQSVGQEGSRVVVAIDDAHLLDSSTLGAFVSVLQGVAEPGVGLHLILFTNPGLPEQLDSLGLLDVEIHDSPIPAFARSEVEQFLYAKGHGLNRALGQEELNGLWRDSAGRPGQVLSLLSSNLKPHKAGKSEDTLASQKSPKSESSRIENSNFKTLPFAHIFAVMFLIVALGWALLVREDPEKEHGDAPVQTNTEKSDQSVASVEIKAVSDARFIQASEALVEDVPLSSSVGSTATSDPKGDGAPLVYSIIRENQETGLQSQENSSSFSRAKVVPGGYSMASLAEQQGNSSEESVSNSSLPNVNETGDLDTSVKPRSTVASSASLPAGSNVAVVSTSSQGISSAAKLRSSMSSLGTDLLNLPQAEATLLGYPGSGYVLQLMAASDLAKLQSHARKQPNWQNLLIYRSQRGSKTLFILVEGFYSDKDSAISAIRNLPEGQKKLGVWPKNISAVHREIQTN